MRTHTNTYKQNVSLLGREIDAKITYELEGVEIELGSEDLNSVTPIIESDILKSAMRQLEIDSNVEIPKETTINLQFGVKVDEDEHGENVYEYLNFGNYIVFNVEKQEDVSSYKITCYDKMLHAMKMYENVTFNFPMTVRDYLIAICDYLQIEFADTETEFANYDKVIDMDMFLDDEGNTLGYTFRDVLDQLAEVTASFICINETTDKMEIRYVTDTNDTIDEEYLKDINVNFGEKYGPVNSIVLSRAAESDNVYLQDEESVAENGLCEIKIKDNQIMSLNNRSDYLEDILDKLDGLEYYINDFTSTGITYYQLGDKYNIQIGEETYPCILFNDEIDITQGLVELIHTDSPEVAETDYTKADKTDIRINQTYITVNKQQGEIEALTSRTTDLEDEYGNTYTIEQINQLIQEAATGITNTFTEAGGNNIFRNTGLWFTAQSTEQSLFPAYDIYPSEDTFMGRTVTYEYWNGNLKLGREEKASNGRAILLQNDIAYQEQTVANGRYTVSFKYKKLINTAHGIVTINGTNYDLTATDDTEFVQTIDVTSQYINVGFDCDVDNGIEIYDLMVNGGPNRLAYGQNQNETTTETVNISKGITITSTDTDTTFKANADGIRTLDKAGNVLTQFTDTGMTTKKMIVENEAEFVGLLVQKVGDQTWFTKL